MAPYLKLGEILQNEGLLTREQLEKAIKTQQKEGGRIGEVLIRLGLITEQDIVVALGKQLNIPYITQGAELLKPSADFQPDRLIPQDFAIRNLVFPISRNMNSLTCAMFDPLDIILIDNMKKISGCDVNPVVATKTDIEKAIDKFYGKRDLIKQAMKESYQINEALIEEISGGDEELSIDRLIARAEEAPVVKLVDLILKQAIDERASDIHIEPFKERISLRYRIDGVLHEIPPPAKHLHLPMISRLKIISKMDIAEKRLPQDGAFSVKLKDKAIDFRVSTVPTIYGEKIVLRILDKSSVPLDLAVLGYSGKQLENIRTAIHSAYGLIFITGPTGSGKTTTLYAILNEIVTPKENILTVEDPVEYRLEGINQIQVKSEIGLTFASALRAFLRQDPDIIMVGEVRDLETAQICVRSALTGHLVFSTLHTNDAPSAITRLVDIGVESYLLMPSLLLIIAQRLVRKLCPDCKEPYEPTPDERKKLKLGQDLIYKAKGCDKCNHVGYKGRVCIAETLLVTDDIRKLIAEEADSHKIKELAHSQGMLTLTEAAIEKAKEGVTSLEEALSSTLGEE